MNRAPRRGPVREARRVHAKKGVVRCDALSVLANYRKDIQIGNWLV